MRVPTHKSHNSSKALEFFARMQTGISKARQDRSGLYTKRSSECIWIL